MKIEEPSRVRRCQEREEICKAGHCPFPRQTWAIGTASTHEEKTMDHQHC